MQPYCNAWVEYIGHKVLTSLYKMRDHKVLQNRGHDSHLVEIQPCLKICLSSCLDMFNAKFQEDN